MRRNFSMQMLRRLSMPFSHTSPSLSIRIVSILWLSLSSLRTAE